MDLKSRKELAARTFGVGLKRIKFVETRLEEIKEALTKQDIKDLHKDGAIIIRNVGGRKKLLKRKAKRTTGNVRKKVNKRKTDYVILTRKLRAHLSKIQKNLTKKEKEDLRNKIKNRFFSSKSDFKNYIAGVKK